MKITPILVLLFCVIARRGRVWQAFLATIALQNPIPIIVDEWSFLQLDHRCIVWRVMMTHKIHRETTVRKKCRKWIDWHQAKFAMHRSIDSIPFGPCATSHLATFGFWILGTKITAKILRGRYCNAANVTCASPLRK